MQGNDERVLINSINNTLKRLVIDGLVNQVYYRPESYLGRGNLPNVSGLSDKGVAYATEHWPFTYPKAFSATHSPHTIEHDLKRARTHIAISALADKQNWDLGWQKGGYHLVKPDDVFELTGTKTAHFFFEEEHKKKDFEALYTKLKPYVDLHGKNEMKAAWGFRYYTVIIPMRDREAMENVLSHFKGVCNCIDRTMKYLHRSAPFKLITDVLAFTTHEDITARTGEAILHTTKRQQPLSFMDILG